MDELFIPKLHLIIQASIPVFSAASGMEEYNDLKTHLLAISPNITLNGQITSRLEPCCNKKPKGVEKPNENL